MNILVCVKRVPLTGGKMVLTADERDGSPPRLSLDGSGRQPQEASAGEWKRHR